MARETWLYRPGHPMANDLGMVPKHLAGFTERRSGVHVISDAMEPTRHPSNGRIYDSKSAFRAETRARGLTEVGNEKQRDTRKLDLPPVQADIARAMER